MKRATISFAVMFALILIACGDSGPTSPTQPPPPQRVKAQVSVAIEFGDVAIVTYRPPRAAVDWDVTLRETAGTGVNLNYIRLEVRWAGHPDYKSEIGARNIIAGFGTNRIEPNGTWGRHNIRFVIPLQSNITGMRLTFGMTDDLGNDVSVSSGTGSLPLRMYDEVAKTIK